MALAVSISVSLLTLAAVVILVWLDRRFPARARRVVVNLDDGTAVQGLIVERTGPWIALAQVSLLRDNGAAVQVDGIVWIERPRVVFLQVLR